METRASTITTCGQAGPRGAQTAGAIARTSVNEACKLACDGLDGCQGVMIDGPQLDLLGVQRTLYQVEVGEQGHSDLRIFVQVCWTPKKYT